MACPLNRAVSVGFGLDETLLGRDARIHVEQGRNLLLFLGET